MVTRREEDLLVLLKHARSCDGRTQEGVCPICRRIDRQLLDGVRYAVDDREVREDLIRRALASAYTQAQRISAVLEGAPIPSATRQSVVQLADWVGRITYLLDAPLTPGTVASVPRPSGTRAPRTPVVISD